jgi:hypothetical protein
LSDTLNLTVPDPEPDRPEVIAIHDAPDSAVHVHADCAVTTLESSTDRMQGLKSTGATEYWHTPRSPDCVSVNVWSAIRIVAVRAVVSGFLDTE